MIEFTDPETGGAAHADALADTHEAYYQYHGWVLTCCWCEYRTFGDTKREALDEMRKHYRDIGCEADIV